MSDEHKVTRKLRAIFSADVKGYSVLMADDEVSTIQTLKDYRNIMSTCIEQRGGRIVDAVGDNLLAEFDSAVDAVQCAVEIQVALREPVEVPLRIGIHAGDIVIEEDNVIGDAVNLAARIESFSVPGAVLISAAVFEQIQNQGHLSARSRAGPAARRPRNAPERWPRFRAR